MAVAKRDQKERYSQELTPRAKILRCNWASGRSTWYHSLQPGLHIPSMLRDRARAPFARANGSTTCCVNENETGYTREDVSRDQKRSKTRQKGKVLMNASTYNTGSLQGYFQGHIVDPVEVSFSFNVVGGYNWILLMLAARWRSYTKRNDDLKRRKDFILGRSTRMKMISRRGSRRFISVKMKNEERQMWIIEERFYQSENFDPTCIILLSKMLRTPMNMNVTQIHRPRSYENGESEATKWIRSVELILNEQASIPRWDKFLKFYDTLEMKP
ncbi:hypothetical protein V1477_002126 [Vespula maculifrons]|uniref:Uncharacterized protein n=1 Tax=Vespula maculifrons TaxID=7453 RepID=A0ABD2CZJ6_VESMC